MEWTVYMLLCGDDTFYTGITIDLKKRFNQHNADRGAKYLRGRKPLQIVYVENGHNRSSASRREHGIKRLARQEKIKLIDSDKNVLKNSMLLSQNRK